MNNFSIENKRQFYIALAIVFLILGIDEYINPTTLRPTGRWSFLFGPIWDYAGSLGILIYWGLMGFVFITLFFIERKK